MSGSTYDWSTTASSNDSADGDIDWTEGQNAKTVNNSARQMMGRIAEYRDDQGGLVTIGGTANAITATLNSSFTTLADGRHFTLQPTSDNTGAVTLNVNGIGAKAIRKFDSTGEVALNSGDLQSGAFYKLIYDSSANSAGGAWIVLNPTAQPQNSKLTDIAALTPTDGNIIVGDGTTWVAESGSTARASIGAVGGPASATDSNFAAFDSTTGKLIKDSGKSSASFATAAQGTKADGATQATDLASTSASKGASLVGVQDSAGNYTGTTIETVLAEIATRLNGYESSQQTITNGTDLTLAHGLGGRPKLYMTFLRCATAELGYSVGDEVVMNPGETNNSASDDRGMALAADATNLYVRIGSDTTYSIIRKDTNAAGSITFANWKLIARAWL